MPWRGYVLTTWRLSPYGKMRLRHRAQPSRLLLLAFGLVMLVSLIWLGFARPESAAAPTAAPAPSQSVSPRSSRPDLGELPPTPTLNLSNAGGATPADPWADALLDIALPLVERASRINTDGLAWWESSAARGDLLVASQVLLIGSQQPDIEEIQALVVFVPDVNSLGTLIPVAEVDREGPVLQLVLTPPEPAQPGGQWLLSDASFDTALQALATRARQRDLVLSVAYTRDPFIEAQIVLVGQRTVGQTPTATPAPETGTDIPSATPTLTLTSTIIPTATSTRQPEEYMGRLIAQRLDPVIDRVADRTAVDIASHISRHAWAGPLTWTETGAQIAGRSTAVAETTDLFFYQLDDLTTGDVTRFLRALYDGQTTRLPDEQVYFQGQRMNEILYWMARRATERGGRLIVSYDDFGAMQVITVVGFEQLNPSR